MSDEIRAVEIRAELRQVKTMADHTFNITLNIPEDCREQVKKMLDWLDIKNTSHETNACSPPSPVHW